MAEVAGMFKRTLIVTELEQASHRQVHIYIYVLVTTFSVDKIAST